MACRVINTAEGWGHQMTIENDLNCWRFEWLPRSIYLQLRNTVFKPTERTAPHERGQLPVDAVRTPDGNGWCYDGD
jgi:hypothetical protein